MELYFRENEFKTFPAKNETVLNLCVRKMG